MLHSTLFSNHQDQIQKNRAIAKEIMQAVLSRFPYGGVNISANIARFYNSAEELEEMIKKIEDFHGINIPDFSTQFLEVKAGFCDELSYCSVQFATRLAPGAIVELVGLKHHVMLVTGRDQQSNPNNIDTWGKDAILFCPWATTLIKADQFKTFREQGTIKKIPFVKNFAGVNNDDDNYFDGEPFIDIYHTLQNIGIVKNGIPQSLIDAYIQQIKTSYQSLNEPLPDINSCLRIAASRGHLSNICFLLNNAGADINSKSPTNGKTALYWAHAKKHLDCEEYLKSYSECNSFTLQKK
jgi:hypothetical protein